MHPGGDPDVIDGKAGCERVNRFILPASPQIKTDGLKRDHPEIPLSRLVKILFQEQLIILAFYLFLDILSNTQPLGFLKAMGILQ